MSACSDTTAAPTATPANLPRRASNAASPTALEILKVDVGEQLFADKRLSLKGNQSCASCHDGRFGFTSPNSLINATGAVMEGSVAGRFGNRRPPTAAYASYSPTLY